MMPSVVLDTVVFVRSLINPHGIWGRLVFAHFARYRLCVSEPVVREVLEVLRRPELNRRFRTLPELDQRRIVELLGQAESVEIPTVPRVSRDVKDDKLLATAEAAHAHYLVTEDEDLLVLKTYEGVRIVSAAEFMRILDEEVRDLPKPG